MIDSATAEIRNVDGTKRYPLTVSLTQHDDDDTGYTEIIITLDTAIELEGPDKWYLYCLDGLYGTVEVEHNYYRNEANDDKYLTQAQMYELMEARIAKLESMVKSLFKALSKTYLITNQKDELIKILWNEINIGSYGSTSAEYITDGSYQMVIPSCPDWAKG